MLNLKKVRTHGGKPVIVTPIDVLQLEVALDTAMPPGYRDYILTLGEGCLGALVRVYPPWRILYEIPRWRARIQKHWFWSETLLTQAALGQACVIADTVNGDELIFLPARKDHLFILPISSPNIVVMPFNILAVVEWMCRSTGFFQRFWMHRFEPFDSRHPKH